MDKIKHIELNIGNACNARCTFCMSAHADVPLRADKNLVLKSIAQKSKEYNSIGFIGGEPTIFPELTTYIKLAKHVGYKEIQITTNGLNLSKFEYFQKLVQNGLNTIKMSMHSFDAQTEFQITKIPQAFEMKKKALENYNILKKDFSLRLDTQTVVSRYNYQNLGDIAQNLLDLDVNSIRFEFVGYYSSYPLENLQKSFLPYSRAIDGLNQISSLVAKTQTPKITIAGFPICFLLKNKIIKSEKDHIVGESHDYFDQVDDLRNNTQFSFLDQKINKLRYFPLRKCKTCPFKNLKPCPGFPMDYFKYLEEFGISENLEL